MNVVILCEGSSDATLLGQYMMQAEGFVWRDPMEALDDRVFDIRSYDIKDRIQMYDAEGDALAIWAVDGSAHFADATKRLMQNNRKGDVFSRADAVAVVMDYDSEADANQYTEACMAGFDVSQSWTAAQMREQWCKTGYQDDFEQTAHLLLTAIWIPSNQTGALESFLLEALKKQDDRKKNLAKQSEDFVQDLINHPDLHPKEYLRRRRDCVKAPLTVYFAIASPNRMMQKLREALDSVDWSEYREVQTTFARLSRDVIRKEWKR